MLATHQIEKLSGNLLPLTWPCPIPQRLAQIRRQEMCGRWRSQAGSLAQEAIVRVGADVADIAERARSSIGIRRLPSCAVTSVLEARC
ncbi:hypothetical protein A11G_0104830 [Xanthomonas vasicola pv. musacearum NCPPB 4392]|nr:hypothetical protein A11G_0104830 [Xanthomonas vasicola pv. musacearum NCPPB 4392]